MANTLLTISMITKESLRVLENNLTFAKGVNRQFDDKFGISGAKIGDTLNIRKPARYIGRSGRALATEDITETSVPLQLDTQFGVDISFTSKDMALSIDEFSDRFLKPAMATVANKIDRDGLALYKDVYNSVGTPGTTPTTLRTYLQAGAKLDYEACPRDSLRSVVIDPNAQVEIVDALKGLFQSSTEIKNQYESGNMGLAAGFKWSMDQNVQTHTLGPLGGASPLTNGVPTSGATTLVTDGWTAAAASRLKKGDVFTIANVFAVNPQSRQSTGQLRQFTVTADVSSDGSGNATIPISPAITLTGPTQNVSALPADNAAITVFGVASTLATANMAYHRDAFVLACADLPLPGGVDMASRVSDKQLGLSARMVRAYNINTDELPCRLDVLYGWKTVYPEFACRIMG
jgi:hypothetical protein